MAERISRRKLAGFVVDRIDNGNLDLAVEELAAYLIDTKRTREAGLVARSIEDELATRGTYIVHATSARPINEEVKDAIQRLLNASKVHLVQEVDARLIGGIRVEAPGKRLDATVKRKILALNQVKM
ncbi:MAG: F0F1 ATP synthase subunit delta [Candidatus Saccharimonas sp.]